MLAYRIRRLPAAWRLAATRGRAGGPVRLGVGRRRQRGHPPVGHRPAGPPGPDPHRGLEEHIVADVPWAACRYADWTGDDGFLEGPATRPGAGRREAPPWPSPPAPPCRSWWSRRTARPLPAGLRRILVPLDGTAAAARVVEQAVQWFAGCGVQIVGVHVFDAATVPRFWDRPEHDPAVWSRSREFLARNLEAAGARLELGSGWPYERILDVAAAERADMIALAWRRQVAPDRAAVVRAVLTRSPVPTILLPVPPDRPRQGCTPGPPDPDKAGRSAGAPAVPMAEAQEGGSRPSRDRGGDEP